MCSNTLRILSCIILWQTGSATYQLDGFFFLLMSQILIIPDVPCTTSVQSLPLSSNGHTHAQLGPMNPPFLQTIPLLQFAEINIKEASIAHSVSKFETGNTNIKKFHIKTDTISENTQTKWDHVRGDSERLLFSCNTRRNRFEFN